MGEDQKKITLFKRVNGFTGPLALTRHHWRTKAIAHLLAHYTWRQNRGAPKTDVEAIAEEWRRMFGLNKFWKIAKIEDDTAYCEIHFDCSLEKSGDVHACHRLMEYDRALLGKIGGRMIVLASRADPGVTHCCRVAIRRQDDERDDLIDAHRQ